MVKKVLIVEDSDNINEGIKAFLNRIEVQRLDQVQYCDDAILKIKRAAYDNDPYDLLITDLSFEKDHREQKITSGEDLVRTLREEQNQIPIIVYSIDDRLERVRRLVKEYKIQAYVCKWRRGLNDLKKAIECLKSDDQIPFLSSQVKKAFQTSQDKDINDYDIQLLEKLALGYSQSQIRAFFKEYDIKPNSISSIEKRLNRLKELFRANNITHLFSVVKDLGVI